MLAIGACHLHTACLANLINFHGYSAPKLGSPLQHGLGDARLKIFKRAQALSAMCARVLQACSVVSDKALQLTALYNTIANTQALVFATANSTAMARDFREGNPATV